MTSATQPPLPKRPPVADAHWAALAQPTFRALWLASIASNLGTWMHEVAAALLMTDMTRSPLLIALLQSAASVPVFLFSLPAGAIADLIDRRRLLLVTQAWMAAVAAILALVTVWGKVQPAWLLLLTGLLATGSAFNQPAWAANLPDLVRREELVGATNLNSAGFNLTRALGPALGGLVVAASGPAAVFFLNALSFLGVIWVLARWRPVELARPMPAEDVWGAMRAGLRYIRHSALLWSVLLQAAAFALGASVVLALLPVVGRGELGLSAFQYGLLFGCFGIGAVVSVPARARLQGRLALEPLVFASELVMAGCVVLTGLVHRYEVLCLALFVAGAAWTTVMSSFNVAAQAAAAPWVRARALSVYLLVFMGSMAAGSALWGAMAVRFGTPAAYCAAAVSLVCGAVVNARRRLARPEDLDLSPTGHWPQPALAVEPGPDEGPVMVTVEYRIDPARRGEFVTLLHRLGVSRRRDGAYRWRLFEDLAEPGRFLEMFLIESWAEHLRQHARVTAIEAELQARAEAFQLDGQPPRVTHLLAARK